MGIFYENQQSSHFLASTPLILQNIKSYPILIEAYSSDLKIY